MMRLLRTLILSAALLVTAALMAGLLLAVLLPWEEYERRLQESLNARLPVRMEFDRLEVLLKGGPGVAIEPVRLLQKARVPEQARILTAHRLVLRLGRIDLHKRQLSLRVLLEGPVLHLLPIRPGTGRKRSPPAPGSPPRIPPGEKAAQPQVQPRLSSRADDLSDIVPLPGGFSLGEVILVVRAGSVNLPSTGTEPEGQVRVRAEGIRASATLHRDLSFQIRLAAREFRRIPAEPGSLGLSARVSADVRGRAIAWSMARIEAGLRLGELAVRQGRRRGELAGPITASFLLQGASGPGAALSGIRITGPGMSLQVKVASVRLDPASPPIVLRGLGLDLEGDSPLYRLMRPWSPLSARVHLHADKIGIDPSRTAFPRLPEGSFRPLPPPGIDLEGLRIHVAELHLPDTNRIGPILELRGGEVRVEQHDRQWAGTVKLAHMETKAGSVSRENPVAGPKALSRQEAREGKGCRQGRGEKPKASVGGAGSRMPSPPSSLGTQGLHLTGPVSAQWKWSQSEGGDEAGLVFVMDLTGARVAWGKGLDKPQDVLMQIGLWARVLQDRIRIGRAFLQLADMEWNLRAEIRDPGDPFIKAELATGVLPLEDLGRVCPMARDRDLAGRLEVKDLSMVARLNRIETTAVVKVRAAGKDLQIQGASIQGLYVQALYGDQKLTVQPVVIHPPQGMIEAELTADLAPPRPGSQPNPDRHAYYGTVKINNVGIDTLARILSPGLAGKAHGIADMNLAFRGSGLSWPEAAENLEARARMFLNHLSFEAREGQPPDPSVSKRGLATHLDRMARELQAAHAFSQGTNRIGRGRMVDLPKENRAAGSFTVLNGTVSTRNLVVLYEGKLIEIQGSMDLSGRLHIDKGNLILGKTVLPFRLDCRLGGQEPCRPRLDVKELGKNAAAELARGVRTLSKGAASVFQDLLL